MLTTEVPRTILNAVGLGAAVLLLAFLAQFPRLAWLFPLTVLGAGVGAMYAGILAPDWALDSLLHDAPWLGVARVLAVQLVVVAVAGFALGRGWTRVAWLALASPLVVGHPEVRAEVERSIPDPRARAGVVVLAGGIASALPLCSPLAGLLGWTPDPTAAVGALVIGLLAWWVTGRGGAAPGSGGGVGWGPVRPVLLVVPMLGMVAWMAAASGALDFVADALEQAPLYVPRITHGLYVLGAALIGLIGSPSASALLGSGILERAAGLRGDAVREMLYAGVSLGVVLPMLVATRSRVRSGLLWWLAQLAWVIGVMIAAQTP